MSKTMQSITIGRYEQDPEAQGCIRPEDGRWQLVIDRDGYPHLYVEVNVEAGPDTDGKPAKGLLLVSDLFGEGVGTIREIMEGTFGGHLLPEDQEVAHRELISIRAAHPVPCPR